MLFWPSFMRLMYSSRVVSLSPLFDVCTRRSLASRLRLVVSSIMPNLTDRPNCSQNLLYCSQSLSDGLFSVSPFSAMASGAKPKLKNHNDKTCRRLHQGRHSHDGFIYIPALIHSLSGSSPSMALHLTSVSAIFLIISSTFRSTCQHSGS